MISKPSKNHSISFVGRTWICADVGDGGEQLLRGDLSGRAHDVSGMTSVELQRARRDLEVSLALAFPGSPNPVSPGVVLSGVQTGLSVACKAGRPDS
jgi:hypothetical protein